MNIFHIQTHNYCMYTHTEGRELSVILLCLVLSTNAMDKTELRWHPRYHWSEKCESISLLGCAISAFWCLFSLFSWANGARRIQMSTSYCILLGPFWLNPFLALWASSNCKKMVVLLWCKSQKCFVWIPLGRPTLLCLLRSLFNFPSLHRIWQHLGHTEGYFIFKFWGEAALS